MLEVLAIEPKTQVSGITVVINGEDFGWKQFKSCRFEDMRSLVRMVQVTTDYFFFKLIEESSIFIYSGWISSTVPHHSCHEQSKVLDDGLHLDEALYLQRSICTYMCAMTFRVLDIDRRVAWMEH
jgi:hypothetical protein